MLTISIDRDIEEPVYRQVADQLRRFIASGALAPGAPLPSVRQLARDLGVNLNTIARAYRLLEAEAFLEIRDRAGVTVAAPVEKAERSACGPLLEQLKMSLARLRQAGMTSEELTLHVQRELCAMDVRRKENGNG